MVGLGRFELPTSRLSGVRSNQLSYRPEYSEVGFLQIFPSFIFKSLIKGIKSSASYF